MKLVSAVLLAFSLSADAFVIQTANNPSSSTSLKDVGLQWGFDEKGCRAEYYLEHWTEHNNDFPQSKWAFDPWSGVSQTIFIPGQNQVVGEMQQRFASKDILGSGGVSNVQAQAPTPQQAAPLPPSEAAQPMPEAQVPVTQGAAQMT